MRDENDSATLELDLPKKRGRPAKSKLGPMTAAERAKAYRRKFALRDRTAFDVKDMTTTQLVSELSKSMTSGFPTLAKAIMAELSKRIDAMQE